MKKFINFETYSDKRGSLTVIEKKIPFKIQRIFYIYGVDKSDRGFHKHKLTRQVAIAINGSCEIIIQKKEKKIKYHLDSPKKGLLIEPEDFHWMENFTKDCILLVIASTKFDNKDYIYARV